MSTGPAPASQPAPASPPAQDRQMGAGRVLAIVAGSLLALLAAALVAAGIGVLVAQLALRDGDGYFNTPTERLRTPTRALTAERVDLGDTHGGDWAIEALDATVRVRAQLAGGGPVFVGIARDADLDRYLRGVAHTRVRDWEDGPVYAQTSGTRVPPDPATRRFWVASASGPGPQQAQWKAAGGRWGAVVMRAGAGRGVVADVRVGAKVGWLGWLGLGILVAGLLVGAGGGVLIWLGARRPRPPAEGPFGSAPSASPFPSEDDGPALPADE